jgi:hypothetical protein
MRLRGCIFGPTVVALVLAVASVLCGQSLQVTHADGTLTTLTAAQISVLKHVTVNTKDHDTPAQFEGIPVADLLKLAGVEVSKMKGPQMTQVLSVEAADGYEVVFALAEFDPDFANRQVILADKRDGKPLDAKEGPWRIVAPGDKRPARWIRQVTSIKVVTVK